jgi:hypothetical protein
MSEKGYAGLAAITLFVLIWVGLFTFLPWY